MIDHRSLRVRLTVTFVAVAAVMVTAGYVGAAWLLNRAVWRPLDAALLEEATSLDPLDAAHDERHDRARAGSPDDGSEPFDDAIAQLAGERDLGPNKFVVVTAVPGRPMIVAGSTPGEVDAPSLAAVSDGASFFFEGAARFRLLTHHLPGGRAVLIGVRVDRQVRALRRELMALAFGAIAMLAGVGILAWSITTRATREMEDVTSELEGLEADAMSRRLGPRTTTEVARLTDALNRLLTRLEVAQRRLQRFTADAAHELRTPLAALRATLDVAIARPASTEGDRNALFDAIEQAERLAVLAEDLLTLSAIESAGPPAPTPVNLGTLASEVAEFLDPVAQEQQRRFVIEVDRAATVPGEPPLLRRLLLNLLGNAFTHTAPGVSVQLAVRRSDGHVELEVRDRGAGIPPAEQGLLFERFAASRRGAGAGLGLAICREIVGRHRGSIALDSGPQGTTVTVRLPAGTA